jgi:hypothetical protein
VSCAEFGSAPPSQIDLPVAAIFPEFASAAPERYLLLDRDFLLASSLAANVALAVSSCCRGRGCRTNAGSSFSGLHP